MYKELLRGAYDLHVHTGPDVLPRKLDDIEMAKQLTELGMKGHGIKSHYFFTGERAKLINSLYEGYNAIGALCLNNSVGGLNPIAIEMAALGGAKIVWMPTFDAENEITYFKNSISTKQPHWAKQRQEFENTGKPLPTITILDEHDELKQEAIECLEAIAKHNLILATGHLGKKEIFKIVSEAKRIGVQKIAITHPNFPSISLTKEEQKALAELGAIMEHCYTTPYTGKCTWESVFEEIRYIGPNNVILSTDLGQPKNVLPAEGLLDFITQLINHGGFTKEEIRTMTVENTTKLVED